MLYTPHIVWVYAVTTPLGAQNRAQVPTVDATYTTVPCQVESESSEAVARLIGEFIARPKILLAPLEYREVFKPTYQVKWVAPMGDNRIYAVVGDPLDAAVGGMFAVTDHVQVVLKEW